MGRLQRLRVDADEGFATFLSAITKQAQWGPEAYQREIQNWRARSARAHEEGHDAPVSLSAPGKVRARGPSEDELQVRGVTYYRGALVLDRLQRELGEERFWAGIRRYVEDHAGSRVRTEDLRASLERATGQELGSFFEQWVYTPAPSL